MAEKKTYKDLEAQIAELELRLKEATDTLDAIRTGGVDALVVNNGDGHHVYTLKSADQTYRVFIEKMSESAITLNAEGLIVYCNSSFAKLLDMPLPRVAGKHFLGFIPEQYHKAMEEIIADAWDAEDKGETMLLKNDGSHIPVLFSLTTLELDEGTALSIILTDLSLQKENERQLQQKNQQLEAANLFTEKLNNDLEDNVRQRTKELLISREHFRFLADNIPVITWTAQADGKLSYFNKRWYEYSGLKDGEEGLAQWASIIHPDDVDSTLMLWKESIDTGEPYRIEYRLKAATDNKYRWHYGHALPYKNDEGEIVSWFGISTDIEHQKRELEKKDEFISMVSHELKTPVTSLKGFTQLLMAILTGNSEPVVHEYLGIMNNQINKLTRLISDLLDATKFNGGQMKFDEEVFDLNALANEIGKEMQLTTYKHRIVMELDQSVNIRGDRNRIGQVMVNLISNAIKYSPMADKVMIGSKVDGNNVVFIVKDFGIGISKLEQPKLYTRFFRAADSSYDNTFPGMGLGLYISMGIIAKHHGSMNVESEANKGSTFSFTLPISREQ